MNCLQSWPEPVVRVQSLSESGIRQIPHRYVKPASHRPSVKNNNVSSSSSPTEANIPVIDFQNAFSDNQTLRLETLKSISLACSKWGFFQIVNHGVRPELLKSVREVWREFFNQPLEVKQEYANSPDTYEGYGSRLGVEKGASLDWSDYFFLHYMPVLLRNHSKWPRVPASCRYCTSVLDP